MDLRVVRKSYWSSLESHSKSPEITTDDDPQKTQLYLVENCVLRPPDFASASTSRKSPLKPPKIAKKIRLQAVGFNGSRVASHGFSGLSGFLGLAGRGSRSWVPLELLNRRILVLAADHGGSDLPWIPPPAPSSSRVSLLSLPSFISLNLSISLSLISLHLSLSVSHLSRSHSLRSLCISSEEKTRRRKNIRKKEKKETTCTTSCLNYFFIFLFLTYWLSYLLNKLYFILLIVCV